MCEWQWVSVYGNVSSCILFNVGIRLICKRLMPSCREPNPTPCSLWLSKKQIREASGEMRLTSKLKSVIVLLEIRRWVTEHATATNQSVCIGGASDAGSEHLTYPSVRRNWQLQAQKMWPTFGRFGGCESPDFTVLKAQSVFLLSPQHRRWKVPSKCHWSWKWSW